MATINLQISLGTDDCRELNDSTVITHLTTTLIGYTSYNIFDGGFRWQSVNIPNSATISSAILSVYIDSYSGSSNADIKGIDEDNTATWSSGSRPSQRAKTTASVNADHTSWGNYGAGVWATIDIKTVVQEIVNRGGWSANNAMAIAIIDTAGTGTNYMSVRTYEYAGNLHGAKLDIVYSDAIPMFKVDHGLVNHGLTRGGLIS